MIKVIFRSAALLCVAALLLASLVGCERTDKTDDGVLDVLCVSFAEYDWVRSIVRGSEGVRVSLLISNGAELHGYDPSPSEMIKIKTSDVVVSVGGVSDEWIDDAIAGEDVRYVRLSQIEGISKHCVSASSLEHQHEHQHGHDHDVDEHIWLSPKNARVACEYLAELFCELDGDRTDVYRENAQAYAAQLDALDASLTALAEGALAGETLIFADRFPFVYMLADYGIEYHAAFEGCDTDSQWTASTAISLAKKLDEVGAEVVLITESADGELARSAIESSQGRDREVLVLDSMQTVGGERVESESYVSIMRANIAVLSAAYSDQSGE